MILEKWYADVVDAGRVTILYRAQLRLGAALIGYARCVSDAGPPQSSLGAGVNLPVLAAGRVHWPAPSAGGDPAWCWDGAQPRETALWQRGAQALGWNPLVLNGCVHAPGLSPAARGYVERLTINFGPWHLGLRCLKWGRFCGRQHSLVWIEWQGQHGLQLALLDGQVQPLAEVSTNSVRCTGARLALASPRSLVHETIGLGALLGVRLPRRAGVLQFLAGVEAKWLAMAELRLDDGTVDEGHAVFEEVVWP